ncbi:MAG: hypothetical protein ACQER7_07010 [Bacteroidota bacterium]
MPKALFEGISRIVAFSQFFRLGWYRSDQVPGDSQFMFPRRFSSDTGRTKVSVSAEETHGCASLQIKYNKSNRLWHSGFILNVYEVIDKINPLFSKAEEYLKNEHGEPVSFNQAWKMFQETDKKMQETDRKIDNLAKLYGNVSENSKALFPI